jgi:phosphoribosylaminoimidazole (AIR) synthetase
MEAKDFIGPKVLYHKGSQSILSVNEKEEVQLIADIRGWGAIQNLFRDKDGSIKIDDAGGFQDEVGEWLADAINKKLEETRK